MDSLLSNPEHNTEDKSYWVDKFGLIRETQFCETICPLIKKEGVINPDKVKNPYAPDLLVNGKLSDLKYQSTPFYSCEHYYGYNPQFTCVFNHKDLLRYSQKYPELDLYFWINYPEMEKTYRNKTIHIHRIEGVFFSSFKELKQLIEVKKSPSHDYIKRTDDLMGNAKSSYLIDIRDINCLTTMHGSELLNTKLQVSKL